MKQRQVKKVSKKKKKVRLKYKNILILFTFLIIIILSVYNILTKPIKNIYVNGNTFLKEQAIIELAKIENYPSLLKMTTIKMKKNLQKSPYIKSAKVKRVNFYKIYIDITENRPLFYDEANKRLVLSDNTQIDDMANVPYLINYVPDTVYTNFINAMGLVKDDVLYRISEIKYNPNEVDDSRFLLNMNDGNYVYLTISKFDRINSYIDIVKNFNDKKGILYLDSGEYFEILGSNKE